MSSVSGAHQQHQTYRKNDVKNINKEKTSPTCRTENLIQLSGSQSTGTVERRQSPNSEPEEEEEESISKDSFNIHSSNKPLPRQSNPKAPDPSLSKLITGYYLSD